jgi:hypothetical protein
MLCYVFLLPWHAKVLEDVERGRVNFFSVTKLPILWVFYRLKQLAYFQCSMHSQPLVLTTSNTCTCESVECCRIPSAFKRPRKPCLLDLPWFTVKFWHRSLNKWLQVNVFFRGGTLVTVTGSDMDSVASPIISLTVIVTPLTNSSVVYNESGTTNYQVMSSYFPYALTL